MTAGNENIWKSMVRIQVRNNENLRYSQFIRERKNPFAVGSYKGSKIEMV